VKLNYKLLYLFTLAALCLYMVTAPAQASSVVSSPYITSAWTDVASSTGDPTISAGSFNTSDPYHVKLDNVDVECPETASCMVDIQFYIIGMSFPATPLVFVVSLTGSSSDPGAYGVVSIDDPGVQANWHTGGAGDLPLVLDPLSFSVTPNYLGNFEVQGHFIISSLPAGGEVSWGLSSLDFNASDASGVPEPASALLLVGGLALVEFLRRKARA
jgi:hypothetical protein